MSRQIVKTIQVCAERYHDIIHDPELAVLAAEVLNGPACMEEDKALLIELATVVSAGGTISPDQKQLLAALRKRLDLITRPTDWATVNLLTMGFEVLLAEGGEITVPVSRRERAARVQLKTVGEIMDFLGWRRTPR